MPTNNFQEMSILQLDITPPLSSTEIQSYYQFGNNIKKRKAELQPAVANILQNVLHNSEEAMSASTKFLLSVPAGDNVWKISDDGTSLRTESKSSVRKDEILWLRFVLFHFFRPIHRTVNGILNGKIYKAHEQSYKVHVKNNIINLELHINEKTQVFSWDPIDSDVQLKKLIVKIMRIVLGKSGLKEWKIVESKDSSCHIDPLRKTVYLGNQQLFQYCKQFGMKGIVALIKNRIAQFPQV